MKNLQKRKFLHSNTIKLTLSVMTRKFCDREELKYKKFIEQRLHNTRTSRFNCPTNLSDSTSRS